MPQTGLAIARKLEPTMYCFIYRQGEARAIKTYSKCGMGGHYCRIVSLNVAKSMKVNGNNSRIGANCSRRSHTMPMGDAVR